MESPVGHSTGQAVEGPDVQQSRKYSLIDEKLLERLNHASSPRSDTLLEAGNEKLRPMPPVFQERLRELRIKRKLSEAAEQYYLNLRRGDSLSSPGDGGRKSLLKTVLDGRKSKRSGWKQKEIRSVESETVSLWEKSRRNLPVWLRCSLLSQFRS